MNGGDPNYLCDDLPFMAYLSPWQSLGCVKLPPFGDHEGAMEGLVKPGVSMDS